MASPRRGLSPEHGQGFDFNQAFEEKSPVMWAATYGEAVRNDDSWEVESVVQFRSYYRKEQWLVKWKGYGEDRNTWEPWENLLTEKAQEEALAVKEAASSGGR